ncbi:MAG: beta-ketoacyl-[acyl-carrier-protein] synthase family protein [SAR324 cluster bacterium]
MPDPIFVTGLGLATSLGFGLKENWRRLIAGDSGIALLDPSTFAVPLPLPTRLGAILPRDKLAEAIRGAVPRSVWNTSADVCHAWLLVALEALAMAGLAAETLGEPQSAAPAAERRPGEAASPSGTAGCAPSRPARVGIYVGNGAGAATFTEQEYANVYTAEKAVQRDISRMGVPKYMASSLAAQLSILIGAHGPALTINTACSSGATALVLALDQLRLGRVDRAVVGGADLPLAGSVLKGFSNLGALSPGNEKGAAACRPFDAGRDGFVLGEGAACLVLETARTALARAAKPVARIAGGAASSEAHHLLAPQENGAAMAECMREALRDSGVAPGQVCHVYAHGTGTLYNDRCEAQAISAVLPHGPTISATKSQLGHSIGAAGAIDAVLAAHGVAAGEAIPCHNLDVPDPECPVTPARTVAVPGWGVEGKRAFLVNSFAFGGHNATIVLVPAE